MVVAAVHQHCVQDIVGRVLRVWLLEEFIQGQLIWELKPAESCSECGREEEKKRRETVDRMKWGRMGQEKGPAKANIQIV